MSKFKFTAIAMLLAGLLAASVFAQETTGRVQGTVTDPSGAVVPNATVQLTRDGTSIASSQTSGTDGVFIFNLMPPGVYTLRASADGFRAAVVTGITIEVNRTTRADVSLQVGTIAETVEVSASAARIDAVSAQVSTNVSNRDYLDLPSSSRNSLAAAEMAPGVSLSNSGSQVMNIEGTYASVNGQRRGRNVFYMDGSDNTGSFRNSGLQFPNPDAIQEISVSTSSTSAEFGKQPGGTFNVITKSGTNELHGSGFYFFRNENLNANTFDRNRSGSDRPPAYLKQGGGTIGGPVIKNKTFFFGSYMKYSDQSNGFQNNRQFPTTQIVSGDLSEFKEIIYDPQSRLPFANNRIPTDRLDPVAQNILKLVPTVAHYGDRYVWSFSDPVNNQEVLGKLDHQFGSRHSVSLSYFHTWGDQKQSATAAGGNVPGWGPQVNAATQDTASAKHTWIVSPTILLQSRFAIARHDADRGNANLGKNLADFGAKWPDSQDGARKYLPQLNVSDGFVAYQGWLSKFLQQNYRFGSTLSWVKGKHNIRFGGEMQRDTVAQRNDQDGTTLAFNGQYTSPVDAAGKPTRTGVFGYSMADMVLGRVTSFSASGILDYDLSNWSSFFFIQDEWRITSRLTLSPGLRYEAYNPATEKNGRADGFLLGHRSSLYPNAPVNLAFQGDNGIDPGFFAQDRNNWGPRLGVAYDLNGNGKTVLRGGIGYYYSYSNFNSKMWTTESSPWRPRADGGGTSNLTDPWGTSSTITYSKPPTPFTTDVSNFPYPSRLVNITGFDDNFRTPYILQWNATIARELFSGVTIEAGYVGNRAFKLLQQLHGNLPVWDDSATLNNIEARRPIAGYGRVGMMHSRARSWYDAFQLSSDVRLKSDLRVRFTYVYASAWDLVGDDPTSAGQIQTANPMNLDGEKAQSAAKHTIRSFWVYDIPFLKNNPSWAGRMLGGWQYSGSLFIATGSPISVGLGEDWNYDDTGGDRPDLVGSINYTSGSKDARATNYFGKDAFAKPTIRNTFGNLPRNYLWGPGQWSMDSALLKNFKLTEQMTFQFRAEAYNLLNHNNLSNPNTTMNSADFTRITSRYGSRTMQLGMRLSF